MKNKIYWRNKKGEIECPGDKCPQKNCTEECPIWQLTLAAGLMAIDSDDAYEKALELLLDVIKKAPDSYDAWNNAGSCNGLMGNDSEAHYYFEKAIALGKDRPAPYYGIIVSCKNLNNIEEAKQWLKKAKEKFPRDTSFIDLERTVISIN